MLQFLHKCTLFYKDEIMPHLLHIYSNFYADKTICKENALNSTIVFLGKLFQKKETLLSCGGLGESAAATTEWNKK